MYASAVLRFEVAFPAEYPEAPPLVTISTDVFHPLLVPLTTYSFSTETIDSMSRVSVVDEDQRLPGTFCLRHGFRNWFRNAERTAEKSKTSTDGEVSNSTSTSPNPSSSEPLSKPTADQEYNIVQVLEYMKSAFEDASLLDNLPVEYAGNPGAWHAWRAYRNLPQEQPRSSSLAVTDPAQMRSPVPKHPSEWNWDGVWEARVKDGVDNSFNEATLFGNAGSRLHSPHSEPIRFTKLDQEKYREARAQLLSSHGDRGMEDD